MKSLNSILTINNSCNGTYISNSISTGLTISSINGYYNTSNLTVSSTINNYYTNISMDDYYDELIKKYLKEKPEKLQEIIISLRNEKINQLNVK